MRVLIVSDAWSQINGVVRTLTETVRHLRLAGHEVRVFSPDDTGTVPNPFYPPAPLALPRMGRLQAALDDFRPEFVHIAVEGPLGWMAVLACKLRGWRFTTAYHTKFPEYAAAMAGVPVWVGQAYARAFHGGSARVMVATPSLAAEVGEFGIRNTAIWRRGVDLELFRPMPVNPAVVGYGDHPAFMYVGRVSVEKNIEAFLKLDLPGTKIVVGPGPDLPRLQAKYPSVRFLGPKQGDALAECYSNADVTVFPSRTDTFGLTVIESMACGTPVAAFPATGPKDTIVSDLVGCCDEDLRVACLRALVWADRVECRRHASTFSWEACTREFESNLVPI